MLECRVPLPFLYPTHWEIQQDCRVAGNAFKKASHRASKHIWIPALCVCQARSTRRRNAMETGAAYDPENSSRVYIARHRYLRI